MNTLKEIKDIKLMEKINSFKSLNGKIFYKLCVIFAIGLLLTVFSDSLVQSGATINSTLVFNKIIDIIKYTIVLFLIIDIIKGLFEIKTRNYTINCYQDNNKELEFLGHTKENLIIGLILMTINILTIMNLFYINISVFILFMSSVIINIFLKILIIKITEYNILTQEEASKFGFFIATNEAIGMSINDEK